MNNKDKSTSTIKPHQASYGRKLRMRINGGNNNIQPNPTAANKNK